MAVNNNEREGLLAIGTLLSNGKYRIEQYLSSGGFGNTYVATDLAFDEKVAIKELYIKGVCGRNEATNKVAITLTENQRTFEAQREKFRKEARRLRRLSNAHIVKVHDLFDENGTSYYVMDFIEGESLGARIKRMGHPMSPADIMLTLPQILDALETVHNDGIWHLDMKPGNIMIDRKGNIQLIDFGASKQLRNSDGQSLATSSAMAYTPGYAPSEQMEQNIEKFGPWTDLYALGATLFNLLTEQTPPSPSDIDDDVNEAIIQYLPATVSTKLRDLIVWLMKPNRKMRPQSVADVRQYLAETITQNPQAKPKPTPKPAPAPTPEPTPAPDPAPEPSTRLRRKKGEPETPTPAPEPTDNDDTGNSSSRRKVIMIAVGVAVLLLGYWMLSKGNGGTTAGAPGGMVTDATIRIDNGPENLRTFTYTGEASITIDDQGDTLSVIPQGSGHATYMGTTDIPSSEYTGQFKDGLPDDVSDDAKMVFSNNDTYVGSFSKGNYYRGTYTIGETGAVYRGTFSQGVPHDGYWYDKSHNPTSRVNGGQEVADTAGIPPYDKALQ